MYYKYTNTDYTGFQPIVKLKDNYLFHTFFDRFNSALKVAEIDSNGSINYVASGPYTSSVISNILGNYFAGTYSGRLAMYHIDYTTETITYKNSDDTPAAINSIKIEQKDANTITIFCATLNNLAQYEYNISDNSLSTIETTEDNSYHYHYDLELTQNYVIASYERKIYSYRRGALNTIIGQINSGIYNRDIELNTLNSTKYLFTVGRVSDEAYNFPPIVDNYNKLSVYSFNDTDGTFTFITSVSGTFSGISTRVDGSNIIFYTTKLESGNYSFCSYTFNGTTISPSESFGTTSFASKNGITYNDDYVFVALTNVGVQTYGLGVSSSSYSSESSASSTSLESKSSSSLSHSSLSSISSKSSNSSSFSSESSDSSLSSTSLDSKSSTSSISSLSLSSESSTSSSSSNSSLSSDSSSSNSSTSSDSSLSSISLSSISQSSLSSDSSFSSESSDSSNSSSSNSSSSNSSQSSSSTTLPITILTELDVFTGENYFKTYNKNRYVFCCTDTGLDVHKVSNTGEISPLIANNNVYPTGFSITGIGDYIFVPGGGSGLRIFHWDEANEILTYKTGNYQSGNYQQVYVEQFDADNITIFVTSTTAGVLQYNYNTSTNSLTLVDSQDNGDFYMAIVATPNYIVTNNGNTLYSYSRTNNLIGDSIASSITYGGTYYRELNINYLNDTRYIFAAKDNGLLVYTIDESTGVFTQVTVITGMFKSVTTRQDGNRLIVFVTKDLGDTHKIQCYTFNGTSLTLSDTIHFTNLSDMRPALSMDADFIYAGGSTEGLKIYRWVDNYSESSFSSISSSSTSSDSSFSSNSSESSESLESKSSTSSNSSSSNSSLSSSSNLSNSSLSSDSSLSLSSTSMSSSSNSSDSSQSSLSSDSSSSISSDSSESSLSSISSNSLSSDSSSSNSSESSESSLSSTSISSSSLSSDSSLSSLSSVSSLSNSSSSLSSDSSSSNSSHSSFSSDSSTSSLSSISWSSTSASSRSSNSSLSLSSLSSFSDSSSSISSESSESSISSISLSSLSSSSDSSLSSESSPSSMSSTSSISFSSVSSDSSSSISSESSFSSNSSISNSSSSNSSNSSESSISSESSTSVSSTSSLSSESSNSSSSNSSESSISLISKSSSSISSDSSQSSSSLSSESSLSSISSSSLSSYSSSSNSSESSFSLSSTSSESSTSSISSTSLDSKSSRSSSSSLSKDSKSSYSSSSLMLEPIDWRITEALIAQLETMSSGYNIKVREVKLLESELRLPEVFPAIIVCPNEIDSDQENISRNDFLPFALVYIDDSNETNLNYRFRNVPADVQRCLRKNQFMDSLAHYTSVQNWENSTFEIDGIEFPCCIIYITIERRMDAEDPYKLL